MVFMVEVECVFLAQNHWVIDQKYDPCKAFVLHTESTTGWWKEYCTGIQETWVPVALPQPAVCSQANHLTLLGLTCFICAMGCWTK